MQEDLKKAIAEIKPKLQADGGDIELVDFKDGVVKVRLKGACGSCPMAQVTLTNFVQKILVEKVKGVKSVESA